MREGAYIHPSLLLRPVGRHMTEIVLKMLQSWHGLPALHSGQIGWHNWPPLPGAGPGERVQCLAIRDTRTRPLQKAM